MTGYISNHQQVRQTQWDRTDVLLLQVSLYIWSSSVSTSFSPRSACCRWRSDSSAVCPDFMFIMLRWSFSLSPVRAADWFIVRSECDDQWSGCVDVCDRVSSSCCQRVWCSVDDVCVDQAGGDEVWILWSLYQSNHQHSSSWWKYLLKMEVLREVEELIWSQIFANITVIHQERGWFYSINILTGCFSVNTLTQFVCLLILKNLSEKTNTDVL